MGRESDSLDTIIKFSNKDINSNKTPIFEYFVASMADTIFTINGMEQRVAEEVNPIVSACIDEFGYSGLVGIKLIASVLPIIIPKISNHKLRNLPLYIGTFSYFVAAASWYILY